MFIKVYSSETIELAINDYCNGLDSVPVVANRYGMKGASLNYHLKKRGLIKRGNGGGKIVKEAVNYFTSNADATISEVSKLYGMTHDSLYGWLRYHNRYENREYLNYDRGYFSNIDSIDKMYWLGFIFADGTISSVDYGDDKYTLAVTLSNKDFTHLEFLRQSIGYPIALKDAGQNCLSLRVSSKEMVNDLVDKGLTPRKSLTIKYPEWVKQHPMEKYFILGFFDGNGCVTTYRAKGCIKPKIVFDVAGTLDMVENIGAYLERVVGVSNSTYPIDKIYVYRKAWNNALKILDHLYSENTLCLSRKRQIYMDYCRLYRCD